MSRRKIFEKFEKQKEFVEDKINNGIELHRKGYAKIAVKDKDGNAVSGAKVKVKQKTHEFKFGANLFMIEEFESAEKNEKYKEFFADTFNMATLPFYWDATEPERGHTRYDKNSEKIYRRPPIDLCVEFCEKHGIEPREHALAYEINFPKWLSNESIPEIKKAMEKRYKEISERYADKIPTIEVTNEMEWGEGRTAFYDDPEFIEFSFKLAEKYFPSNQLVINEHAARVWTDVGRFTDKYYAYTEAAMAKGARIDAIGIQYHMFHRKENEFEATRKYYDPEWLYKVMDLYAGLGKPLQITEVTIPAYSNDTEDEKIQAEMLEMLYSIWFSHPSVEQIIYWNLVDGYAYGEQGNMLDAENYYYGGLIRYDMTPKPAYYTIKNLLEKKWHTEAEIVSDADGDATFKGFYGKYEVQIHTEDKTVVKEINFMKKGKDRFEIVI